MGAVDPCLAAVVEKLDGHEQPSWWMTHEPNELDPAPIPSVTLTDVIRRREHRCHVPQAELKPARTPSANVRQLVRRDQYHAFESQQVPGKNEPVRDEPRKLGVLWVGIDRRHQTPDCAAGRLLPSPKSCHMDQSDASAFNDLTS
jgi:hypothetical protein